MNAFDWSLTLPLVAVMVTPAPLVVSIALLLVHTPLVKAPVLVGEIVPMLAARFAVLPAPLKLVTVLLLASSAVIVTLKTIPAVCGLLIKLKVK